MSDFECLPIGTAERLADLEAENASLAQLLKDIPPFEAECEECFDKRHLLEADVERLLAQQAELLAALKPVAVRGEISAKIIKDARAAIAKSEGQR
jgi:septal ring factor EnvC (AmiA/AmiB activator)